MSHSQDIIYIGNPFYTDNRTSSHHVARHLSKDYRLIYIEAGGLRSPRVNKSDLLRIVKRLQVLFKPIREVEPNIFVKSIFALPFGSHPLIGTINRKIQHHTLKGLYRRFGLNKPIIWCVSPALIKTIEDYERSLLVYYCVDDFSSFPDVDVALIKSLDKQLTQQANVIFTPSEPLFERKKQQNDTCFLSPHGVDVDHFGRAMKAQPKPQSIEIFRDKTIIGFWGLIEHWIDLELVFFLAKSRPELIFFMIGRVAVDLNEMNVPPNVQFVGQIPYEELPVYAHYFSVAIIPYKLNDQVYNANPLKLREYLATGKPIISVRTPETEKYNEVIAIADDYESFLALMNSELAGECFSTQQARLQSIENESWSARYQNIKQKIEHLIAV